MDEWGLSEQQQSSPACCPECGSVLEILLQKDEVIRDQSVQISTLRAQVRKLRNARMADPAADPFADDAREVYEHWKQTLCPRSREFTGARFDKVVARLRAGATVPELKRAVDGMALSDFHMKRGAYATRDGPKYNELERICESESKVQAFIALVDDAEEAERGKIKSVIPRERLAVMQQALDSEPVLARLQKLRGWDPGTVRSLGLGLEGDRVVFPVYDAEGKLTGISKYQPNPDKRKSAPKNVAQGSRDLWPSPESERAKGVWLVEGEPDALAARTCGLTAISAPGVNTWKDGWAERFSKFDRVYVCFDCDDEGRQAAEYRRLDLAGVTHAMVVDLDPRRNDGYDINDLLRDVGPEAAHRALAKLAVSAAGETADDGEEKPYERWLVKTRPWELVIRALLERDCKVQERSGNRAEAQCPNHDDARPSLSLTEGDDERVLLHCHAGCQPADVVAALGLELKDLFA